MERTGRPEPRTGPLYQQGAGNRGTFFYDPRLFESQLLQIVFIKPEVVSQFVDHRLADFLP